jgi:hypothetical protein
MRDISGMSAVLRAYGANFDVDAFLKGCTLSVCAVKRRGEPVLPASQPNGRRHTQSGIHVSVSDADFRAFQCQIDEAISFLMANTDQISRLSKFPGIENITLDFGIARREAAVQCDHLPTALVQLAASLGLAIEISHYPVDESADSCH